MTFSTFQLIIGSQEPTINDLAIMKANIKGIQSDLLTVVSITLGFYIAVMTILFGSKLSQVLIEKQDEKNPLNTELHTLLDYFQSGMTIGIMTIVLIVVHALLFENLPTIVQIVLSSVCLGLFVINLLLMTLIFVFLKNAIVADAKRENKRK